MKYKVGMTLQFNQNLNSSYYALGTLYKLYEIHRHNFYIRTINCKTVNDTVFTTRQMEKFFRIVQDKKSKLPGWW